MNYEGCKLEICCGWLSLSDNFVGYELFDGYLGLEL
jgi:hypothetical protein